MAKSFNIGKSNSALGKTKKGYFGDTNSIPRKIKKMFIGDANGKPRVFFGGMDSIEHKTTTYLTAATETSAAATEKYAMFAFSSSVDFFNSSLTRQSSKYSSSTLCGYILRRNITANSKYNIVAGGGYSDKSGNGKVSRELNAFDNDLVNTYYESFTVPMYESATASAGDYCFITCGFSGPTYGGESGYTYVINTDLTTKSISITERRITTAGCLNGNLFVIGGYYEDGQTRSDHPSSVPIINKDLTIINTVYLPYRLKYNLVASNNSWILIAGGENVEDYIYTKNVFGYNIDFTLNDSISALSCNLKNTNGTSVSSEELAIFSGYNIDYSEKNIVEYYNTELTKTIPAQMTTTHKSCYGGTKIGDYVLFGGGYVGEEYDSWEDNWISVYTNVVDVYSF